MNIIELAKEAGFELGTSWYGNRKVLERFADLVRAEALAEPKCSDHPDAPHGFDRNASHSAGRYVCECEGWEPVKQEPVAYWDEKSGEVCRAGGWLKFYTREHDQDRFTTPLYAAPVDAKAILETERKRHSFELSIQEELFADKAEVIRAEALEEAAKVCEQIDTAAFGSERPAPNDCAAAIRGLK